VDLRWKPSPLDVFDEWSLVHDRLSLPCHKGLLAWINVGFLIYVGHQLSVFKSRLNAR
jgi:hypothetical protein